MWRKLTVAGLLAAALLSADATAAQPAGPAAPAGAAGFPPEVQTLFRELLAWSRQVEAVDELQQQHLDALAAGLEEASGRFEDGVDRTDRAWVRDWADTRRDELKALRRAYEALPPAPAPPAGTAAAIALQDALRTATTRVQGMDRALVTFTDASEDLIRLIERAMRGDEVAMARSAFATIDLAALSLRAENARLEAGDHDVPTSPQHALEGSILHTNRAFLAVFDLARAIMSVDDPDLKAAAADIRGRLAAATASVVQMDRLTAQLLRRARDGDPLRGAPAPPGLIAALETFSESATVERKMIAALSATADAVESATDPFAELEAIMTTLEPTDALTTKRLELIQKRRALILQ